MLVSTISFQERSVSRSASVGDQLDQHSPSLSGTNLSDGGSCDRSLGCGNERKLGIVFGLNMLSRDW